MDALSHIIEEDLCVLNIGLHTDWRRAQDSEETRKQLLSVVGPTLHDDDDDDDDDDE